MKAKDGYGWMSDELVLRCTVSKSGQVDDEDSRLSALLQRRLGGGSAEIAFIVEDGGSREALNALELLTRLRGEGAPLRLRSKVVGTAQRHLFDADVVLENQRNAEAEAGGTLIFEDVAFPSSEMAAAPEGPVTNLRAAIRPITHDLNNVLGSIRTATFLLSRAAAEAERGDALAVLDDAVQRAIAFSERLAQLQNACPKGERSIGTNELTRRLRTLVRRSSSAGIPIDLIIGRGEATATCDPHAFEQAVEELIRNAEEAIQRGGVGDAIRVSGQIVRDAKDRPEFYCVEVHDNGPGISDDIRATVADPMVTTKRGPGSGLGLSIVREFCEGMGGGLQVESATRRGTTARMSFPLLAKEAEKAETLPANSASGERVLLVDDDEFDIRLIGEALSLLGYEVVSAHTAAEALAKLIEMPDIKLLLTDLMMPEIDGGSLARNAKVWRPALPIIYITGAANRDVPEQASVSAPLLRKPVSMNELNSVLQRSLTMNH